MFSIRALKTQSRFIVIIKDVAIYIVWVLLQKTTNIIHRRKNDYKRYHRVPLQKHVRRNTSTVDVILPCTWGGGQNKARRVNAATPTAGATAAATATTATATAGMDR